MIAQDFIGLYYIYDYRTRTHSQVYMLEILALPEDKVEFILQTTVSGNFGSSGIIWKGNCKLKSNQLLLDAVEENDWQFTAVQIEKEEHITKISKTFKAEIIRENDCIVLNLTIYENPIKLVKINENIDKDKLSSIVFWITREIIDTYNLRAKNLEFEPSRFWRISNLMLKSYNEIKFEGNNAIEISCEFDLDLVKEEKRVVDNDEIVRKHHVSKAIFSEKFKILNFKSLE
jgi:hypothetical protein